MTRSLLQLMRPWEWAKNVFVLPALVFALPTLLREGDRPIFALVAATAGAFAAFSLVASGFYCINDALDAERDALHPHKRGRPIASGRVAPATGYLLGGVLVALSLLVAAVVNLGLLAIIAGYGILQVLYNAELKRIALVDVLAVATGFALRGAAGAVAIQIQISIWLVLCILFLCLFLGFTKRLSDLQAARAAEGEGMRWRSPAGYRDRAELEWLLGISTVLALMMYVMYSLSTHAREIFGVRALGLTLLSPLILIAMYRLYRRARQGASDSILAALRADRGVRWAIGLFGAGTLVTLYVPLVERVLDGVFLTSGSAGGL
jgi:4-hydroxybenzoate polyprenyltransferase